MQPTVAHVLIGLALFVVNLPAATTEQTEFFEKNIRPIFVAKCQMCHGGAQRMAGLDLSTAAGFRKGADTGALVDAANVEQSRLLRAVGYQGPIKMPPTGKLREEEIASLRSWFQMGAPWPDDGGAKAVVAATPASARRTGKDLWSFQPLKPGVPPANRNKEWAVNEVDRFILAKLEEKGIPPSPPADKLTLIRRATFDLTGLPATDAEIRNFLSDGSPDAFAKVVDRLLASPRYGEKWGRHWLDVARYADSTGADEDVRYPYAWRYRDYVVDAFNRDLPYDQFVREQIAGDLLPAGDGSSVNVRGIVATGFLALGPKLVAEQDKVKMFYDIVDEQIDVTGKAILGLTLACARCHDHKFDPVSTKDYYAMASIFASTKQLANVESHVSKLYFAPLVSRDVAGRYEAHQKKIEEKQAQIDEAVGAEARRYRDELAPRMADYMVAARKVYAEGADVARTALAGSLDVAVLGRWAEYLKPTSERRVDLEPWYQAPPSGLEHSALEYKKNFLATAAVRDKAHDDWLRKAAEARGRGEEPPDAPKFPAGENRFYTEVVAAKGPFGLPEKEGEKFFSETARTQIAQLKQELDQIKKTGPAEPPFACGVAEGRIVSQPVFLRGNPESKGDIVPKRFPTALAGEQQPPITQGSGRLELAHWLTDPGNPLTARVIVNRLWQWHFGQGLVRTPSNFGVAGEQPTHPELLDWLAARFISDGWSIKKMHRLLMLSNAYRMSGDISPESREKDNDGRLVSRFPMRRLEVEEIRDTLLGLDGSIDLTMGGALSSGFGTDKEFSDARMSLSPDQTKRRTVYLPVRRSNLSSLFTLFDFGDGTTSNEERSQTNVAPQALYMMNSAFVEERSRALAQKLLSDDSSDRGRIERSWLLTLGREASAGEAEEALKYISGFPGKAADDSGRLIAWTSFCKTLIASNDFMYVH